jgi:branched-chain amino acid transport system permease protein
MAAAEPIAALPVLDVFARRHRLRAFEALPWLAAVAAYFVFPDYLALGAQILATILFALSLDLVLGYAGIVTLGHAAFFGTGAYAAGILAANGWGEPLSGLIAAAAAAGLVGLASGAIILRTTGLALLMQTLVVAAMLAELANKATRITGGADGLQGMEVWPIFGAFRFDLFGRTAYIYCALVLLIAWLLVRAIVHSPFGRSLTGIRENVLRMHAVGAPVRRRKLIVYTISAALAGIAGALIAQTAQFVDLGALGLERSGTVLIMLIIGGVGQLYGAFIGVTLYMIAQDRFATIDPVYWYFWIGEVMVLLVVFAPGGVLGLPARVRRFASGIWTRDGLQVEALLRSCATALMIIACNLWIAADSGGGALASHVHCLVVPAPACGETALSWLVPLLWWIGIACLLARWAVPRRARDA